MDINLELHPKQSLAFTSKATEVLFGGSAGSGKSHVIRISAISWCYDIPGLNVYLFRRTRPDLDRNHMQGPTSFPALLNPWVQKKWVKINYSNNVIEFAHNNSKIFLCHAQYEHDVQSYQGAEMHVLLIDELTSFSESMYRFLRGWVRLGGLELPEKYRGLFPRILTGSNPGGVGHNWVKQTFVDYAPPMEIRKTSKEEGGLRRQFIPALLEDNPTLLKNDPAYENRLFAIGNPALSKAMRWGVWDIIAGGALDDLFDREIHVVKSFVIPRHMYVDRSFDWGSSKPFSIGWWLLCNGEEIRMGDGSIWVPPPGTLIRVAEIYGWSGRANVGCKMSSPDIAKLVLEKENQAPLNTVSHIYDGPADSSIYDQTDGESIADKMKRAGVTWTRADKRPGSRIAGLQALRDRLGAALAKNPEEPALYVFNTCRDGWIRTVPTLPRSKTNQDDVDSNAEDHAFDETRYRLLHKRYGVGSADIMGV